MTDAATEMLDLAGWMARKGQKVGVSPWRTVTQAMVDAHAECVEDHYWIHTDPGRAWRDSPTGTTIAHGFLTLSLLSSMAYDALPSLTDEKMLLNYGLDRVRFLTPVPVGARVRGVFVLNRADERKPGEIVIGCNVKVEIEGQDRPAMVADWLHLRFVETRGNVA